MCSYNVFNLCYDDSKLSNLFCDSSKLVQCVFEIGSSTSVCIKNETKNSCNNFGLSIPTSDVVSSQICAKYDVNKQTCKQENLLSISAVGGNTSRVCNQTIREYCFVNPLDVNRGKICDSQFNTTCDNINNNRILSRTVFNFTCSG